jgi:broad specificity phosphatase PhoE
MLEIYLVRHGESVGNREDRFRGRHDFPLNENGIRQARVLYQELSSVRFDAIYSSPLKRAFTTAEILANKRPVLKIDNGFTNISLGDWENRKKSEIREGYPDLWKLWTTEPEKLNFPGMETLAQVSERSYKSLQKLIKSHPKGIIAIVSHRAVIKPLIAAVLNIPEPYFWKVHMDTAAYSILEYRKERGFTLTGLNFNKHLVNFIREDLG